MLYRKGGKYWRGGLQTKEEIGSAEEEWQGAIWKASF